MTTGPASGRGRFLLACSLTLCLAAGAVGAGDGLAAGGPSGRAAWTALDSDRLRAELDRTDEVIQRAAESIRGCTSAKAKVLLERASDLQLRARRQFGSGGPTTPSRPVLDLTRRARELAVDAIEHCQSESRTLDALATTLEATRQRLVQARSAVSESPSVETRRLLEAGAWQLEKAEEAYRAGEHRRAVMLCGAARGLIDRALVSGHAGSGHGTTTPSRVESALERTDMILAEVRAAEGADQQPQAIVLLRQADREQERARALYAEEKPLLALRRTQAARRPALDALALLQRGPDADQAKAAMETTARLLEHSREEIRGSGSGEAIRLLDAAETQLDQGRRALDRGDRAGAASAARRADGLLRRAQEMAGR